MCKIIQPQQLCPIIYCNVRILTDTAALLPLINCNVRILQTHPLYFQSDTALSAILQTQHLIVQSDTAICEIYRHSRPTFNQILQCVESDSLIGRLSFPRNSVHTLLQSVKLSLFYSLLADGVRELSRLFLNKNEIIISGLLALIS